MDGRSFLYLGQQHIAGSRRGELVGNLDEQSEFYGQEPVQPGLLYGRAVREYDPDNGLPLESGTEPVRIRDRVNFLRGLGLSFTQIGDELGWTAVEVMATQTMTRKDWRKRVGWTERRTLRELKIPARLGKYPSLRELLNSLVKRNFRPTFYHVILELLNRRELVYTWRTLKEKRIRIWWAHGNPLLIELAREFERQFPSEQDYSFRRDLQTLQQLIAGNQEFYMDFTEPQDLHFSPTDLPHEEIYQ